MNVVRNKVEKQGESVRWSIFIDLVLEKNDYHSYLSTICFYGIFQIWTALLPL